MSAMSLPAFGASVESRREALTDCQEISCEFDFGRISPVERLRTVSWPYFALTLRQVA